MPSLLTEARARRLRGPRWRPVFRAGRPTRYTIWTGLILFLGAALSVAGQAPPKTPPATAASPAPAATPAPTSTDLLPDYIISPGDVLRIAVWKEPELSTEAFVRLDGRITVPLLGDLSAAGRTPNDLAGEIQGKLARFIEIPQVTLAVSQTVSARFFVLGEVHTSGAFPLASRITVLQALALAGGFREFAKRESIVIIRREGARQSAIPFNYKDLEAGQRLDQNIFLESGDTIVVP